MRATFSNLLVQMGKKDSNILLITGDHGYSLFDDFRRECPRQYINAGIAEQNMVGISAGLARAGFRPIVYGLSSFIPIRVLEQIKIDVAYDSLPIIFIGDGAGFVYSHLGTSHQSTEDISCTRAIPNLSVYSPCDRFELLHCFNRAYEEKTSVYIRLGKADLGDIHQPTQEFEAGKLIKVRSSKKSEFSLIATGSMVKSAIDVADKLKIEIDVWSVPFIKPIDYETLKDICYNSRAIVVLEEHSKYGGLGSLVSEIASSTSPVQILQIAVNDRFSMKCGTYEYLLKEHQLDFESIYKKIISFLVNFK